MAVFSADTLSKYGQQCPDAPDFSAKTISGKGKESGSSQFRYSLTMQCKMTGCLAKREQRPLEFPSVTYPAIHKYCPKYLLYIFICNVCPTFVLVSAPHPVSSPPSVLPTGAAELGCLPSEL